MQLHLACFFFIKVLSLCAGRAGNMGGQIKGQKKMRSWCRLIRLAGEVTSQLCAFTVTLKYFPLGPQHICVHVCIGVHSSALPFAVSPLQTQTLNNMISPSMPLPLVCSLSLHLFFLVCFCFRSQPELLPSLIMAMHLRNINNARPCQDFQPAMLPISL